MGAAGLEAAGTLESIQVKSNNRGVGLILVLAAFLIFAARFVWSLNYSAVEGVPREFLDIQRGITLLLWSVGAFVTAVGILAILVWQRGRREKRAKP